MALQLTQLRIPNMTTDYGNVGGLTANIGNQFLGGLDQARKQQEADTKRQLLGSLGQDISKGNFEGAAAKAFAAGDAGAGVQIMSLGQKAKEQQRDADWYKRYGGLLGESPAAPAADLGSPNDVENTFVGTVRQAGLTNPVGLGAVAAYGKAESGFSPRNVNRVWNDPSESGQPGQAGGIMSWRGPRLEALNAFARERGEQAPSPQTQALFLAKEDSTLIPRLNAAKTPQEANQIMANAWRFAGYNRPGGENARREALTARYAQRYAGQAVAPQQASAPAPQGVQVAETEEDVQRLEAGMPGYGGGQTQVAQAPVGSVPLYAGVDEATLNGYLNSPQVPANLKAIMREELARRQGGGGAPVQVAQAPAQPGAPVSDAPNQPAPGAAEAQFVIPGGQTVSQGIMQDRQVQNLLRALDGAPDKFKSGIQKRLDLRIEELKQARGEETRAIDTELKREQLAKARRDNASTAAPTTKVIKQADGSEVAVQWDADTRRWIPLTAPEGGNAVRPAGTKLTEGQSKDLVYHTRGLQALEAFEPVAGAYASGPERAIVQLPGGNYAVSEEFQMARQAGRNFLASILRKDTGAAITAQEEQQYGEVFLPTPGDKPGTIAQKAEARKQAIDAIRGGLGTAEVLAIGQRLVKRGPGDAAPAPAQQPGQEQPKTGAPKAVATPQDYQALKPGDTYTDPQGNVRRKP